MEKRPNLKLELSPTDKLLEISGWSTLAILWILTLVIYDNLPDIIPTHFNASGEANDYGNKMTLMMLPFIVTIVFIGLTTLNRYPHIFNYPADITSENACNQYSNATRMIRFLKFIIAFISSLIVIMIYLTVEGKSYGLEAWLLPVIIALIVIPLAYFTIKALKTRS